MANAPCLFGFVCDYHGISEDGDNLCTHPRKITELDEDELETTLFGFVEECDCPFMDYGCDLDRILSAYTNDDAVYDLIEEYKKKIENEEEENYKEIQKIREEREKAKSELNKSDIDTADKGVI